MWEGGGEHVKDLICSVHHGIGAQDLHVAMDDKEVWQDVVSGVSAETEG